MCCTTKSSCFQSSFSFPSLPYFSFPLFLTSPSPRSLTSPSLPPLLPLPSLPYFSFPLSLTSPSPPISPSLLIRLPPSPSLHPPSPSLPPFLFLLSSLSFSPSPLSPSPGSTQKDNTIYYLKGPLCSHPIICDDEPCPVPWQKCVGDEHLHVSCLSMYAPSLNQHKAAYLYRLHRTT